MSYVYTHSEPGCYTVGFYAPDGGWNPESDHSDKEAAAARVHYLNGGSGILIDVIERFITQIMDLSDELRRRRQ